MKKIEILEANSFKPDGLSRLLVHDSAYFKVLNFNLKAGQELPVHSHEVEGQLSILVLEGKGIYLGKENSSLPAARGDILICDIAEPHGVRAETDMRLVVTIAPPI